MNVLYVLGGLACLGIGIYTIVKQVKIFIAGKQDKLGFDIQGFFFGLMLVMMGAYLIFTYW